MASESVGFLLADLGITKTRWSPERVERQPGAQFKTLECRPDCPGAIASGRVHLLPPVLHLVDTEHCHAGLGG